MITDKNEAFHHNSCKKLAQLSKVIYAMSAQKQDRIDSNYDLIDDFDEVIVDTINQHQYQLDLINNSLYKYRKKCIASSCKHFGSIYKQMKTDYANLISEQGDKYMNLINEIKIIEKGIREFQMKALQAAANFLDNSEVIEKELSLKMNMPSPNSKSIRKEVRPILEKIVKLEDELNAKLNQIRSEYKKKKHDLNRLYQNYLNDIFFEINPSLINKKSQIITLKGEIVNLNNDVNQIVKSHSAFMKDQLKLRNQIISETNQTVRSIQKQINSTSEMKPSDSYFKSVIRNLQQLRIQNQMKFKQKIDQLTKESHQVKHQRHNLNRSKSSQILLIEKQFSDQFAFESQNFDIKKNRLIELNNYHLDLIKAALSNTQDLFAKLTQLIANSIQIENTQKSYFMHGNKNLINSTRDHYSNFIQSYQKSLFSYVDEYNNFLNKPNYNFSDEKELNNKLNDQLNEIRVQFQEKRDSKIGKLNKELTDYKKICDEKKQNLIDSNKLISKQKTESKHKKISEIKNKFISDLVNKKESIVNENQLKIQKSKIDMFESALNLSKEINNNATEQAKLRAKSQYFDQQIEQLKKISQKKIDVLDQQIMNIDKSIRQFQRSMKNETQKIDEDYEIQIQIKQVDLKNKIENISKLFSKEENQRGIEIIEEIRKIKDTKNLTLNIILRKMHEKEDLLNDQKKKINEMKEKIKKIKSNQRENELKEEIKKISENQEKNILNLTKKSIEITSKIKKEIDINKEKNEKQILSINNLIQSEISKFNDETDQINAQKRQIESETIQKIKNIDQNYYDKLDKINFSHQKELKAIQSRIENAKKIFNEYLENSNKEKNQLIQKLDNEANERKAELYQKLIFVDSTDLDYKMKSLLISKSSLLNPPEPFSIRKEDESAISNLQKKAAQKTKLLSMEFNKHIENMDNIFNRKIEEDTSSIINKCLKLSRNENVSHKKMPQLVTPQLVF